jgi:hypothetical protein
VTYLDTAETTEQCYICANTSRSVTDPSSNGSMHRLPDAGPSIHEAPIRPVTDPGLEAFLFESSVNYRSHEVPLNVSKVS